MSKQQLKSAWNGMCTKLHDKLRGDVVKKVDAYKDLRGDLPPLLTLAAFKNSIQGGNDGLLGECVHWNLTRDNHIKTHPRAFGSAFYPSSSYSRCTLAESAAVCLPLLNSVVLRLT